MRGHLLWKLILKLIEARDLRRSVYSGSGMIGTRKWLIPLSFTFPKEQLARVPFLPLSGQPSYMLSVSSRQLPPGFCSTRSFYCGGGHWSVFPVL
jgi:hypothetical protein